MNGEPLPLECPGDPARAPGPLRGGCALTAPVRPRFNTGQQLLSEDLDDLPAWADGRLALGRFRGGWGAVCGLGVSVLNRDGFPELVVHPGYAVGPCGTDIVVEKPLTRCLRDECLKFLGVCRRPAARDEGPTQVWGERVPPNELLWLDLYLEPARLPGRYRPVMTPPGERRGRFEPTREADGGVPTVEVVGPNSVPAAGRHHDDRADPFETARKEFVEGTLRPWAEFSPEKLRDEIVKRMETVSAARPTKGLPAGGGVGLHPDYVHGLKPEVIGARRAELLALVYLGWLSHAPFVCPVATDDRVRLGRVRLWLRPDIPHCRAAIVDAHPPYRREYAPAGLPPGAIDLRPYYGAWYETPGDFPPLTDRLDVRKEPIPAGAAADALVEKLSAPSVSFAFPGERVVAWTYQPQGLGDRILRFAHPADSRWRFTEAPVPPGGSSADTHPPVVDAGAGSGAEVHADTPAPTPAPPPAPVPAPAPAPPPVAPPAGETPAGPTPTDGGST